MGPTGAPGLPVWVLTGPTGTGKSDLAVRLAEGAPIEIVSVDSALVYRGLDVGTAVVIAGTFIVALMLPMMKLFQGLGM